jgi:glycosyltransferase involved in cell wall biosynthesis
MAKIILFNCVGAGPEKGGMYQYARTFIEDFIALNKNSNQYICLSDDKNFKQIKNCRHIIIDKNSAIERRSQRGLRFLRNSNLMPLKLYVPRYMRYALQQLEGLDIHACIGLNQRVDIFHIPAKKHVSVVHDAPKGWDAVSRSVHSLSYTVQFGAECNYLMRNSDIVLTDSLVSSNLLKKRYFTSTDCNHIYFRSMDKGFDDQVVLPDFKSKLPKNFFYYPSTTHPVKNHKRLIKAISLTNKFVSEPYSLVLSGPTDIFTNKIKRFAAESGLNLKHVGYVSEIEKNMLYKKSCALIMPSLFNFTNIPLFEALALNTHVLCSDVESSREIFGNTFEYFNPSNVESIASSIMNLKLNKTHNNDKKRELKLDEILNLRYQQISSLLKLL